MKSVSEEYKIDTNKDFRNRSYCEIELDLIEFVSSNISIESWGGQTDYSNTELVNHIPRQAISYATLEKDRIKLDGSTSVFFSVGTPFSCGFVSSNMSDENGEFSAGTEPLLEITFDEAVSFNGITIWSDLFTEDRIRDFDIELTNDMSETETKSVIGNESVACSINDKFDNIVSIKIKIKATNKPYMRARLPYIDFGIVKIYDNETLMSDGVNFIDRADPLSRELSEQSVEFTVDNYEHEFDIDNPSGMYDRLKEKLPVRARIGYELDNGAIEWVNMGVYYLKEWDIDTYKVRFKAVGVLNSLNDNYYCGFETSNNTIPTFTIEQLLDDLIQDGQMIGYQDTNIYETFQNTSIQALIDIIPKNQVLQYIANMFNLIISSKIDFYNNSSLYFNYYNNQADYDLNKEKYMEDTLKIELEEKLKAVEIKYYKYSVDSNQQEIFKDDINITPENNYEYIYFNKPYGKITYTTTIKSGNPSITYNSISSTYGYFIFSGEGVMTITIKGYPINKTENLYRLVVGMEGEIATFENPLITNLDIAKSVARNIANYLLKRNKYTLNYIGEPMLDNSDAVSFENQFTSGLNLLITDNWINFNGGLSGKIEGKVL